MGIQKGIRCIKCDKALPLHLFTGPDGNVTSCCKICHSKATKLGPKTGWTWLTGLFTIAKPEVTYTLMQHDAARQANARLCRWLRKWARCSTPYAIVPVAEIKAALDDGDIRRKS